jgi:hypothetical protein
MSLDKRNKEHGDDEPKWRDIPVVLVGSIGGNVSEIIPYYDGDTTNADIAQTMADTYFRNGTKFDMYLNGYFYSLELDAKQVRLIMFDGMDAWVPAIAERIAYCQDMHLAFYFPDENPVDTEPGF